MSNRPGAVEEAQTAATAYRWQLTTRQAVTTISSELPAPTCATAGSMSSVDRMAVALSVMSSRLSPASASSVAWHTPSLSFLILLCTLPRKFSTYKTALPAFSVAV